MPNHSSLTQVRNRLEAACFSEVFKQIVEQCRATGLVPGKRIITDASLVETNASLGKLGKRERQTESVEVKDEATFPAVSLANM